MKVLNTIRNILFSLLFLCLCLYAGITTLTKEQEEVSLRENRTLQTFEKPRMQTLLDGSFQTRFSNAFSDQFPLREKIMDIYTSVNNRFITWSYLGNDNDMALVPISEQGVFKVGLHGQWLTEYPFYYTSEYEDMIWNRLANYRMAADDVPAPKYYIYTIQNAVDTTWFDEASGLESAGPYFVDLFKENLDGRYKFYHQSYADYDEYKNYAYKTDHHWNCEGARLGYVNIINWLREDFPQLDEPRIPLEKKTSDIPFYGSYARSSNYNIEPYGFDKISDYVYDLGEYDIYVNGEKVEEFGKREAYFNNTAPSDKEINHYAEIFGKDMAEVIYDFGENSGINALILTDSYSGAIKPVLSSHFDRTYYVDFRHYVTTFGNYMNLKEYVKQHDIDLVLVIGSMFDTMMDVSFTINSW